MQAAIAATCELAALTWPPPSPPASHLRRARARAGRGPHYLWASLLSLYYVCMYITYVQQPADLGGPDTLDPRVAASLLIEKENLLSLGLAIATLSGTRSHRACRSQSVPLSWQNQLPTTPPAGPVPKPPAPRACLTVGDGPNWTAETESDHISRSVSCITIGLLPSGVAFSSPSCAVNHPQLPNSSPFSPLPPYPRCRRPPVQAMQCPTLPVSGPSSSKDEGGRALLRATYLHTYTYEAPPPSSPLTALI